MLAAVFLGIAVVGLWPLRKIKNEVTWLHASKGLHYGTYGTAMSAGPVTYASPESTDSATIEMWLKPTTLHFTGALLAFYSAHNPPSLVLRQRDTDLAVVSTPLPTASRNPVEINTSGIFQKAEPVFITITSDTRNTHVYRNGVESGIYPQMHFSGADLSRYMIVGDAPYSGDSWEGDLFGLAVYHCGFSQEEVRRNYVHWRDIGGPEQAHVPFASAVYLFGEHGGFIVHNSAPGGVALRVPEHYVVVDQRRLLSDWGGWSDFRINVAGFVPFGFLAVAYMACGIRLRWASLFAMAAGIFLSFTIECLQVYLPTRDSSVWDVFTNSSGTAIGVFLYQIAVVRNCYEKLVSAGLWFLRTLRRMSYSPRTTAY